MSLLSVILIILSILGLLLVVFGLQKKFQLTTFFGGLIFFTPIFYLFGWVTFSPLVPAIALVISFLSKKKVSST